MNIVYFTLGRGLEDGDLRRQVLRIPEVMARISKAQKENQDWDLVLSLILDEVFSQLELGRRIYLLNLIQQALFDRWLKKKIIFKKILRRHNFTHWSQIVSEFEKLLQTQSRLKVYVIGPGVDELSLLIKDKKIELIDVIDQDPVLHWFWPELKKEINA